MFLDVLRRRNPALVEAAIALHQAGHIPANCYVLDLDAVEDNARAFRQRADALGLTVFAMTKQVGRNSGFCRALARGGIDRAVAVDMACAQALRAAGMRVGHLGHLVQVPRFEADAAARDIAPDYWTVFSGAKASEAAGAALRAGRSQKLARPHPRPGRHLLPRARGRLRRRRRRRGGGRAGRPGTAPASPGSPPFRRCCSTTRPAPSRRLPIWGP